MSIPKSRALNYICLGILRSFVGVFIERTVFGKFTRCGA